MLRPKSVQLKDDGDAEKRNSAPGPTERGAVRKQARSSRQNSSENASENQAELAVYAGQVCLGVVLQDGDKFTALAAIDDRLIGVFDSLKKAADAVDAAFRGAR